MDITPRTAVNEVPRVSKAYITLGYTQMHGMYTEYDFMHVPNMKMKHTSHSLQYNAISHC